MSTAATRYCYVCKVHHPANQLVIIETRGGRRWRCIRSIEAANRPRHERDAFGRAQTEINRQQAKEKAESAALFLEQRRGSTHY